METSENLNTLEHKTLNYDGATITKGTADSLLKGAVASYQSKKYASARILSVLAEKIYRDLKDGWNAYIAHEWYESSKINLQKQHQ